MTRAGAVRVALCLTALVVCFAQVLPAAPQPARGVLLVASEKMTDPRFRETVILLIDHAPTGSVGVVLNKPLPISLDDAFRSLPEGLDGDAALFYGGPVSPGTAWVVFSSSSEPEGMIEVLPGVFAGNAARLFGQDDWSGRVDRLRCFSGYSGWAPGQLDRELARGDWSLLPGRSTEVFDRNPGELWRILWTMAHPVMI